MPVFEYRWALELGRRTRLFLRVEAGLAGARALTELLKTERNGRMQESRPGAGRDLKPAESGGIKPENIVWILGSGRTGSTWLGRMMGELRHHALWHEPYVGEIFGTAYYVRSWDWQRERKDYILSRPYKQLWLKTMRALVLEGAEARHPEAGGYLVIREPHGSVAAPLLMEAFPESRLVFLVRDPRDVVASRLDAHKKDSWTNKLMGKDEETLADTNPDAFARAAAEMYARDVQQVMRAYDAFAGRKALVRYEDLRADTFQELKKMYSSLNIPVGENRLRRVVEKHDWENIPDDRKGLGKSHRKASPGSWREDLTPRQVAIVEEITGPILDTFYAGQDVSDWAPERHS
jgi:hypothetical protein